MLLAIALVLFASSTRVTEYQATADTSRPNILLIMTDDQRADTIEFMPRTRARIFDEGVTFPNAFATTPLCCPSRASIFTGLYAGHHGVRTNTDQLNSPTFAEGLHAAGYYTGLVGIKYLNSWSARSPGPEFDYWAVGQYTDPITGQSALNVNGEDVVEDGYLTYVYRDYALQFLDRAHDTSDPFMLVMATKAPHIPATPAPGDETLYTDLPLHRPPSFNEADVTDKPQWLRAQPLLTDKRIASIDHTRLTQIQSLNGVDIAVDDMLNRLDAQGKLDNTVVVFMSDNGYLWGEHRLDSKNKPYDEAMRIPMAIRYPPLTASRGDVQRIVANIDIAPTFYDLAGLPMPSPMDGRSLVPLLQGTTQWRTDLLLEGWEFPFNAVQTGRYIYIENPDNIDELYDLKLDPYQLTNQIKNPTYDATRTDLIGQLDRLKPASERHAKLYDDDDSIEFRYGRWQGVWDDRASSEGYRASGEVGQQISYRTAVTTEIGLLTYRGPDAGIASITIDGVRQSPVDLYAPTSEYGHTVWYRSLTNQAHTIVLAPTGQKHPSSFSTRIRFDAFVIAGETIEESAPSLIYTGWSTSTNVNAYQGTYRKSSRPNTSISFNFIGTRFTWLTTRGPKYGIAQVYIDGVLYDTVDLYFTRNQWRYGHSVSGLQARGHVVKITVTGTRNPASRANTIVFAGISRP